jgi:inhibitor of KinA sporulation pathway (predicted exonuclease)
MGTMRFDKIVVVDIESTCWETRDEQGNQPMEVIEIGVCMLDAETLEASRKHSYIVRPKFSEVSKFCTELTGYTWDDVKTGMPFGDACNKLANEYGTRNRVWASWGDYDRSHFERECRAKKARYPFSKSHINASVLFTMMKGNKKKTGVGNALNALGMKFEGTPHKGCDDAWNTAKILRHLLESGRK